MLLRVPNQKSITFVFHSLSHRKSSCSLIHTVTQISVGPRAYFSIKRPFFVSLLRASEMTQ